MKRSFVYNTTSNNSKHKYNYNSLRKNRFESKKNIDSLSTLDSVETAFSGKYGGKMVFPVGGNYFLDLRIDIDNRYHNSPVMRRISGDYYRIDSSSSDLVYIESWIVDNPIVTSFSSHTQINGNMRFWKGNHPLTKINVIVYPESQNNPGYSEVTINDNNGNNLKFLCTKKSDCFRDLELEVDITQSVNHEPIFPFYDTYWHSNRPSDLPRRILTIEECYRETGVKLAVNTQNSNIIDDSEPNFIDWDDAELHDAMEQNFSLYNDTWPAWKMRCLLCGTYTQDTVLGVMFDAGIQFGGAGRRPERQGFAVFKRHPIFNNLTPQTPTNQVQADAMRRFLRTYVHEAGHAFNLLHSWNKDRPYSLSWMNYPRNYPFGPNNPNNSENDYWNNFRFRFDDEELIHIRHGDRASVIMGGDFWSSGRHIEEPFIFQNFSKNESKIEFLLRSKNYFEFMEPIEIELRLKNLTDTSVNVDTLLNPEFDRVNIYILDPNGNTIQYVPTMIKESEPIMTTLRPLDSKIDGADRFSENIVITYGKYGFYFNHPGEYLIRATYNGYNNEITSSNILRIRIGNPLSYEEDKIAYNFFSSNVGMNLYLKGSQSPFLAVGKKVLEQIVDMNLQNARNAKISYVLASAEIRPFFRIVDKKLIQTHKPNYEKTLRITEPAISYYSKVKEKPLNIQYRNIVYIRVNALLEMNKKHKAKEELTELEKNLVDINESVVNEIEKKKKSIDK